MSTPAVFQAPLAGDYAWRAVSTPGSSDAWLDLGATEATQGLQEPYIRRPLRGIVIKKDTHATLSVVTSGGQEDAALGSLRNSSHAPGPAVAYTTNFLLQSVTETRNEKSQFVTTFGATYAFFFGEQPRIINCSAILPNTADFDWSKEWWRNYEEVLRGTTLSSRNLKAKLSYDGQTISGFMTNCTMVQTSMEPHTIQVNFSLFVESVERGGGRGGRKAYRNTDSTDYLGVGALADVSDISVLQDSTTAAVRKTNIKLSPLSGSSAGALSKFLTALNDIDAAMDHGLRKVRNALYGRNMVVPLSFTSSRSNRATFASGSGAEGLEGLEITNFWGVGIMAYSSGTPKPGQSTITLRTNTDGFLALDAARAAQDKAVYNFQNFDEYVNYPSDSYITDVAEAAAKEAALRQLTSEESFYSNRGVSAFAAFGIDVLPFPQVPGVPLSRADSDMVATAALGYHSSVAAKQRTGEVIRTIARVAFGAAVLGYGYSIVNSRRQLQESVTNPNSGGLSASQISALQSEISESQQTAEQKRLVDEAKAAELRGETGTVYPGTLGALLSVVT